MISVVTASPNMRMPAVAVARSRRYCADVSYVYIYGVELCGEEDDMI